MPFADNPAEGSLRSAHCAILSTQRVLGEMLLVGQPLLPVLAAGIGLSNLPRGAAEMHVMQRLHTHADALELASLVTGSEGFCLTVNCSESTHGATLPMQSIMLQMLLVG